MKKLLLASLALGAMGSVALAEPVTLTESQLDGVTAAAIWQSNFNETFQLAYAAAAAAGGCNSFAACFSYKGGNGNAEAEAEAENENETEQENEVEFD